MDVVTQGGIPPLPSNISAPVRRAITAAMQTAKKDRPHTVAEFLGILHGKAVGEETEVDEKKQDEKVEAILIDDGRGGSGGSSNGGRVAGGGDNPSVKTSHPESQRHQKWLPRIVFVVVTMAILMLGIYLLKPVIVKLQYKQYLANIEMVYVEGGTFTMGATSEQGNDAKDIEKPAHSVTLDDYYIGKYEVTQGLWKAVMGSNPSFCVGDSLPVQCVSYADVQIFINKLNGITGKNYRLPTEAEWEYAARGGDRSKGYKYSGSNNMNNVAWHGNNCYTVRKVGKKLPNELGIYDMSGNVWEWCQDLYDSYSSLSQHNPTGPDNGLFRITRGGSRSDLNCRVSFRDTVPLDLYSSEIGFRLAL